MPLASGHPELGYLKVNTKDLPLAMEEDSPHYGLLTPLSSACDGRRASIASSTFSCISQVSSSASHLSSVPSLQSLQSSYEPITPPPQGIPLNLSFSGSDWSFVQVPGDETDGEKNPLLHTPMAIQGNFVHEECDFQHEPDLAYVPRQADTNGLRVAFDGTMPASADFPTALVGNLMHHTPDEPFQWNHQQVHVPFTPQHSIENSPFAASSGSDHGWSNEPYRPWQLPSFSVGTSTIVPTEMAIDGMEKLPDLNGHEPKPDPSSPCSHRGFWDWSNGPIKAPKKELRLIKKENPSDVNSPSWRRKTIVSRSGAKGIRKERRSSTQTRRKAVHHHEREHMQNGVVVTTIELVAKTRKQYCSHVYANGQPCRSLFAREEHLRRHEIMHNGNKPYKCIICRRPFGRQDNKRDHYKTHLSDAAAGRNDRINFDRFYALLREQEEPAEAEKTMAMLEKWRAKGSHLQERRARSQAR